MRGTGDARLSAVETDAVLFLDFDGVLHPYGCTADQLFCRLGLLQDWLRQRPGVDVVISSTWRKARSVDELASIFASDLQPRVIGVTPCFMHDSWDQFGGEPPPPRYPRHGEAMAWLRQSAKPWRRCGVGDLSVSRLGSGVRRRILGVVPTSMAFAELHFSLRRLHPRRRV